MSRIVLDASAVLAVINGEPGSDELTSALLAEAAASAVNLAEVHTKLVSRGWIPSEAWEDATSPVRDVVPFDQEQARITGDLVLQTASLGLSLGDRACLALGLVLNASVYTADKSWKKLKLGVAIHVIR